MKVVFVVRPAKRSFSTALSQVRWSGGRQSVSGLVATVFGASGFVGRYVVQKIGDIGSQVIIPYRGDGQNVRHLKPIGDLGQIVPLPFKITDEESIRRTVCKSSVVINLVGMDIETANFSYDDVHVKIAHQIARICHEVGTVERFIHVSALGADPKSPSRFFRSKAEGEAVVRHFFPKATVIRPAPIYGWEDRLLNRIATMVNYLPVMPVRNLDQRLQPVNVMDVAEAIMNSIISTNAEGKIYHLAGPETFTMEQLIQFVQREILNRNIVLPMPQSAAQAVGWMFEKIPKKFRAVTRDTFVQQEQDLVMPEGAEGLAELAVQPATMRLATGDIMAMHRGDRLPAHPISKLLESRHPAAKRRYWDSPV